IVVVFQEWIPLIQRRQVKSPGKRSAGESYAPNSGLIVAPSLSEITTDDLHTPDVVFQIGTVPNRIDMLTSISGVEFDDAWRNRITISVSGLAVPTIGRQDLIRNKRAAGRPRDLADAAELDMEST
ncbi:MAG: hypothetical protein ACRELT_17035, partial [Longimicrobiales bacterium]